MTFMGGEFVIGVVHWKQMQHWLCTKMRRKIKIVIQVIKIMF